MKCVEIVVVEKPTTPMIVDISTDKDKYKVGDIAHVTVKYQGVGGQKPVSKKICLYVDDVKIADKEVLFEPNKTKSTTFAVELKKVGRRQICVDVC